MAKDEGNNNFALIALVAIVAVVGLVSLVMMQGGSSRSSVVVPPQSQDIVDSSLSEDGFINGPYDENGTLVVDDSNLVGDVKRRSLYFNCEFLNNELTAMRCQFWGSDGEKHYHSLTRAADGMFYHGLVR